MIDGLKLTMTGAQLRASLANRIHWHQGEIRRLSLPGAVGQEHPARERLREGRIGRAQQQIEMLTFICDHIVADEIYRLGELDLRFADLLPEDDGWECDCFADALGAARLMKSGVEPN